MKRKNPFGPSALVAIGFCLILGAALPGCGGSSSGGGGNPPSNRNADFVGTYLFHQIAVDNSTGTLDTTQIDVTVNGDGTGTFTILRHSAGASGSANFTYTVAPDLTFTAGDGTADDAGVLSSDGSLFLVTDAEEPNSDTDGESVLGIGRRKDCTSPPVLSGDYRLAQIGLNTSGGLPGIVETKLVDITITTSSNGNFVILKDSGGATGPGDFTYSVGADCTLTVNNSIDNDFGIVSSDGSRFVIVDADHGDLDQEIVLAIGIRKHANTGTALFNGAYWLGEAGVDASGPFYTAQIDVSAAGDGTATATPVAHSLTSSPGPAIPLTYSISAADGTATVNDGTGVTDAMIDAAGELIFAVDTDPVGGIHLNTGLLH